ncbi:MAG: hypothetical protein HDR88_00680 [Bacteroides sp.]|nr:hypothetical protein [Bacteroides sp.]
MKGDSRSPIPILKEDKLNFFYSILTLWESGKEPKIIKNFTTAEIIRFKDKRDKNGHLILTFSDFNKKDSLQLSEIRFNNVKNNKGLSILYHLRNAFAHNLIFLENNGRILHIENEYRGKKQLQALIAYDVLKELIEILLGKHNLSGQEKKKRTKNKRK